MDDATDFKVNKVFFFHLYCYPALVSFVRTQSGESIRQSERAPWCMSLYTKKFWESFEIYCPVPSERGHQRRNSLLCRTLFCDISTWSHFPPTARSTCCRPNTLKQGLSAACCAAATEIQSNQECCQALFSKEQLVLFH